MRTLLVAGVLGSLAFASPSQAAVDYITNGGFETANLGSTGAIQIVGTGTVAGWNNPAANNFSGYGYTFVSRPGAADSGSGGINNAGGTAILYGPDAATSAANYSNNGLTTSPVGGNFVYADADSQVSGPLQQTVTGLTAGTNYLLSFYWAGAQMSPVNNSSTTESWKVSFGNATQQTNVITTAFKGFTPWTQATMLFTATGASQLLSFLAVGTPNGEPPTALLDGVSLVAAPEPATWALLVAGTIGVVMLRRRNRSAGSTGSIAA